MLKYILTFILFFAAVANSQASNKAYRSLPFPPTQISKEVMDEVRDINSKFTSIESKLSSMESKIDNMQIQLDRIESKLESKLVTSRVESRPQPVLDDGITYSSRVASWGSGSTSYGCTGSITSRVFDAPAIQSRSFGSTGSMVAPAAYPAYHPQETIINTQEVYMQPVYPATIYSDPVVLPENKPRTTLNPGNILRYGIRSKAIRRNNNQSCPGGVCPIR